MGVDADADVELVPVGSVVTGVGVAVQQRDPVVPARPSENLKGPGGLRPELYISQMK